MMPLPKDPGQQIINACADNHSQMVADVEFFQERREHYIAEAAQDCTASVDQTDEDVIYKTLSDIGNRARWLSLNGNLENKIDYIGEVLKLISTLIHKHAEVQASLDLERHWGEGRE